MKKVLAGACLVLGMMWWLRPHRTAGPQTVTLEGRLPDNPNVEIRAHFPDLNYTASCRAGELGQPGQPFKWTVQVPGKPGQVQMQTARPHLPPVSAVPVAVASSRSVQVSPPPAAPSATTPEKPRRLARQKRHRAQRRLAMHQKRRDHRPRRKTR
ncbi:MAG: hypothetical protein KF760_05410 [Candidatus Eremiobacteraeota bacterium]|nr:hypothetical protein [Candidatus Eremiobacteraeota bacterium]MCW5867743.1 hypothetical protein [Candidatus Eremiobacteraeota bacterium]